MEGPTTSKKVTSCLIVKATFLQWSGTKPRYSEVWPIQLFSPWGCCLPKALLSCSATLSRGVWLLAWALAAGRNLLAWAGPALFFWAHNASLPWRVSTACEEALQGSHASALNWEPGVLGCFFPLEFCGLDSLTSNNQRCCKKSWESLV